MTANSIEHAIAKRFAEVNENVGLGPNDYTAGRDVVFDDPKHPVITVSCNGSGPLKGHVFKTKGIAELRKIVLNDELQTGPAVRALQQLREEMGEVSLGDMLPDLVAEPGDVDEARILKAALEKFASIYAFGGLGVPQQTLDDIDRVLFPSQLTVYTGEKLVLGPDTTLVIDGLEPIVLNFSYVEMAASSRIAIYSKATLFFGQVSINDQKSDTNGPQILVTGAPYSAPQAQTGPTGATPEQPHDAPAGKNTLNSDTGLYTCTSDPKNGVEGRQGEVGGMGANGGPGRHLQAANIDIYATSGQVLQLAVQSGCGQDGGVGGQGGAGGPGGFAGYAPVGCLEAKHGMSGPGGTGGHGGNGGDGGQAIDPVRVVQRDTADIKSVTLAGRGGAGGKGGAGGISPDGTGDGGTGPAGVAGKPGAMPKIIPAKGLT